MSNKSERRRIEQAFPFIQLYLVVKGGAITNSEKQLPKIEEQIEKILDERERKRRSKLDSRIARLNRDSGITRLIASSINGHKFILIIYYLVINIVENTNTIFPIELENIFQYFLDAENDSPKSDEEVEKLRKSGGKQGDKLFKRMQDLGFYK